MWLKKKEEEIRDDESLKKLFPNEQDYEDYLNYTIAHFDAIMSTIPPE